MHSRAISACESFGVQMSTASMSARATSLRQSVSYGGVAPLLGEVLDLGFVAAADGLADDVVARGQLVLREEVADLGDRRWSGCGP
jgi:hypothetical protein